MCLCREGGSCQNDCNVRSVECGTGVSLLNGIITDGTNLVLALDGVSLSAPVGSDINPLVAGCRGDLNIGEPKLTGVIKELIPYRICNFTVLALVTFVPFLTAGVANLLLGA